MSKVLYCKDVGFDCDYVTRGKDEQEILEAASVHAGQVHGLTELSPEVVEQVRTAIRDEK
jgi:predicted small metal-binding protein